MHFDETAITTRAGAAASFVGVSETSAADSRAEGAADAGRHRLFCALDPPAETVRLISSWQREQRAGEAGKGMRPVAAEALHLTLAFLGDQAQSTIPAVAAVVEGIEPRPVEGRLLAEPLPLPRRRPRLFALEVESPAAELLAAELRQGLADAGVELPDGRPLWPHLTVFRLGRRRSRELSRESRSARRPIDRLQPLPGGDGHAFGFVRVALYRSQLRPEGSSYSRMAAKQMQLPRTGGRQKR